jgi:hypothetical protein
MTNYNSNKTNSSSAARKTFAPNQNLTLKEHRPLRWLVRQFFNEKEEDGQTYQHEVVTGYNSKLENFPGMTPILAQALDSIRRFGGELYADYGSGEYTLVEKFN